MHAQTPSDKGWFQADVVVGCAPFRVEVINNGIRPGDLVVDFEGDPNDPFSTRINALGEDALGNPKPLFNSGESIFYEYTTPGTYLIRAADQTGGGSAADRFDFLTVRVIDSVEPDFTVALCAGNEVTMTFNFAGDQYDFYEIDFGDGQPITNLSKGGSNTLTYAYANQGNYSINVTGQLNIGNDVNCASAPPVNITTLDIIPIPSLTAITSLAPTELSIQYAVLDSNISYELEYDNGSGFQTLTTIDPSLNPDEIQIDDNRINNNTSSYTFRIKASDPCASNEEFSNQASSIGINYSLLGVSNTIDIQYSWVTNEIATPIEFYQNGTSLFSTTDLSGTNNQAYNSCLPITDFFMEKIVGSTVVQSLTITPLENQNIDLPAPAAPSGELVGNNVELTFENPAFAFTQIEVFRGDGSGTYNSIGTTNTLAFTDFNVSATFTEACYVIRYSDECGNISLASAETCIPLEGLLRTPNAFSPNGDGVNDTFDVGNGVFTNFQMLIFNKWGGLVYKGNDPTSGWDGSISGQEAPSGTYLYKISYLKSGVEIVSTGTVTLIR